LKTAKRKPGRPPKPKAERRSKNRTFRVRGQLDEYLIARATESGRSVSEEIEARLERSFYMDGLLTTFSGDAAPLVNALSTAVAFSFLQYSPPDQYKILQVATGYIIAAFGGSRCPSISRVTEMLWPPREPLDPYEGKGLGLAFQVLNNLGSEMPQEQTKEIGQLMVRDRLLQIERRKHEGPHSRAR
jgi:hypothetical protein